MSWVELPESSLGLGWIQSRLLPSLLININTCQLLERMVRSSDHLGNSEAAAYRDVPGFISGGKSDQLSPALVLAAMMPLCCIPPISARPKFLAFLSPPGALHHLFFMSGSCYNLQGPPRMLTVDFSGRCHLLPPASVMACFPRLLATHAGKGRVIPFPN